MVGALIAGCLNVNAYAVDTKEMPNEKTSPQTQGIKGDIFQYFEKELHIDKSKMDFHEVEDYLTKTVPGFDLKNFVLDPYMLMDRNGHYYLDYVYVVDGFETPYYVNVVCENDVPKKYYVKVLPVEKMKTYKPVKKQCLDNSVMEKAKKKALEELLKDKTFENFSVVSQKVTPRMDEAGNPFLRLSTTYTFSDESGDMLTLVDRYEYAL